MNNRKVFVMGLDCAPPSIIFSLRENFPNINRLMQEGSFSNIKSTNPPITIPAWISMMTGKTPGELGVYGFRHRKKGTYSDLYFSTPKLIKYPAVWDILAESGKTSCVVGLPPNYPVRKIEKGASIACFMCPDSSYNYAYPEELKKEIQDKFGDYIFDITFRAENKDEILENLYKMTLQHFEIVKYLVKKRKWDFFVFVEIGTDRINHAFWKYFDKTHQLYKPGNKYENTLIDYYKFIDNKIGELLLLLPKDCAFIVVSDHGAKAMKGAFCVNEWLITKGYLKLKQPYRGVKDLDEVDIDWENTKVWAWGGYDARLFFNVKNREPKGCIDYKDYDLWRGKVKQELEEVTGPNKEKWQTSVYKPEELYPCVNGDAPDLIAYFDDLCWRSAGTIGHKKLYLSENDKGPDDCVHDWLGVFIMYDKNKKTYNYQDTINIKDVSNVILDTMGINKNVLN